MVDYRAYQVDKPYPEVVIDRENSFYAQLLLDDYSSDCGEFTAVSQYVYAHIVAEDKEIQDTFLGIAIAEMGHLDMLGNTILKLGVDPKFTDSRKEEWNSSFVPYGISTKDRIILAIRGEQAAIRQYERHIRQIQNRSIRRILERIVLDEKLHIAIFNRLLRKYYE